jgi:hypothetical protein
VSHSRRFEFKGIAVAALAGTLAACAALPPTPAANHAPTTQDVTVKTASGKPHVITVTIPYRSDCAAFPSYTATYVRSFSYGYVGEWNTKLGAQASMETNSSKKKALTDSFLTVPDQVFSTNGIGLQESNCLSAADLAEEDGRTKAHNDLISNPPVS